jgi:hypothetical protein
MLQFTPVDRPSAQEIVLHLKRFYSSSPLPGWVEFLARLNNPSDFDGFGWDIEWEPATVDDPPKRVRLRLVPISEEYEPCDPESTVLLLSEDGTWCTIEYVEPEEPELSPKIPTFEHLAYEIRSWR